jgi:multidrug resistance efflux pump
VSIEGASKLVSAMVSETDITSIKKGMPVSILVKSSNENLRKRGEFIGKKHGWTISGKNKFR